MISYDPGLVEYFRYSSRFFYLILDSQGNYSYVNPLFQETFSYLAPDFTDTSLTIFNSPDQDKFFQAVQKCLEVPFTTITTETEARSANDLSFCIQWELSAIIDVGKPETVQAIGFRLSLQQNDQLLTGSNEKNEQIRYQAALLENVSDIVISCSKDQLVKTWNKGAESFYHIKARNAIGKKITDLVQIDYSPGSREEAHDELYEKGIWKGKVSYMINGEKKYLSNSLSLVINEDGERMGVMVVGKDITAQEQAEKKLRESELFYRNLFADSLDGILLLDETGKLHFTSPSLKRILGYEPDEIIGRNAFEFVHPDDHELAVNSFMNEVSQSAELKYILVRLLKKTGEWLWCMVRGHNLLNNPHIGRMAIYFHDDTLRREAEKNLLKSESIKSAILNSSLDAIITITTDDIILEWNNAAERIFGYSQEEAIGKQMAELIIPLKYRSYHLAGMKTFLESNIAPLIGNQIEIPALRKDGTEFPSELYISMFTVEGRTLFTGTLRDITERKKLQQQLIENEIGKQKIITKTTVEAQEKERKEIGKELHDNIGQHLTTTQLYLDIAKGTTDEATLELILLSSRSISDVINEIRKLSSSLTPPTLGDLGLVDSIKDLTESIRTSQVFRIRFYHNNFEEDILPENIKLMLFRIIQEQINNIIKHAEATIILIRLITDADQLMLVVADNGKGFNPYSNKKGMGINNIINRAELFDGKVEINTEPGKGCSLVVTVPLF